MAGRKHLVVGGWRIVVRSVQVGVHERVEAVDGHIYLGAVVALEIDATNGADKKSPHLFIL